MPSDEEIQLGIRNEQIVHLFVFDKTEYVSFMGERISFAQDLRKPAHLAFKLYENGRTLDDIGSGWIEKTCRRFGCDYAIFEVAEQHPHEEFVRSTLESLHVLAAEKGAG